MEAETVIIGAAQGGNEPARRQLFAWHFDAVYRFCLALAVGRRELAEETTQQVFVTAARQIGRYDPRRGEFRAWLIGIARNRFLVLQAKERRRRRYEALSGQEGHEAGGGARGGSVRPRGAGPLAGRLSPGLGVQVPQAADHETNGRGERHQY
jgi:RNA polymerase sigma factor (sigma-70 family)